MIEDLWTRADPRPVRPTRRPGSPGPRDFHSRLPGYAPTPLLRLDDLAELVGVGAVWLKHENARLGLPSFKVLGASWAVYRVLETRLTGAPGGLQGKWRTVEELSSLLEPLRDLTLVTATDGNHGRAVARVAALLGMGSHVLVPSGTASARIEAIRAEGARVDVVSGDYDRAVAAAAALASTDALVISDTSWPGYEEVPGWISEGYSTLFDEIDDALDTSPDGQPTHVLVPMGVGALAATTVRHFGPRGVSVVGVEPVGADCITRSLQDGRITSVPGPHPSIMAGLNCGTPSLVAWPDLRDGLLASLVVTDASVAEAMRELASLGVVAGETGAAAAAALRSLAGHPARAALRLDGASRVLLICTESATDPENYRRVVGHAPDEVLTGRARPEASCGEASPARCEAAARRR